MLTLATLVMSTWALSPQGDSCPDSTLYPHCASPVVSMCAPLASNSPSFVVCGDTALGNTPGVLYYLLQVKPFLLLLFLAWVRLLAPHPPRGEPSLV